MASQFVFIPSPIRNLVILGSLGYHLASLQTITKLDVSGIAVAVGAECKDEDATVKDGKANLIKPDCAVIPTPGCAPQ